MRNGALFTRPSIILKDKEMKKTTLWMIVFVVFITMASDVSAQSKGKIVPLKRIRVNDAYTPRVVGLFIGIADYDDPHWHDLKYPKKDVTDMVDFFLTNDTLELDEKIVLSAPHETTREAIEERALADFARLNVSPGDVVIAYVSSHGTLTTELISEFINGKEMKERKRVPYILTSDSREDDIKGTAIRLMDFVDWFEGLSSQRKVLILDMCHSGNVGKSQINQKYLEDISSAKGIGYTEIADSQASIILASCPIGGISYEDAQLQNSVYTHFLLKGMRQGDLNLDGAVSISEAHNFAIDKTRQYTWNKKEYKQIPTAYSKILGKDPIMVSGSALSVGNATIFSYASASEGVEIYLDRTYQGMLPKGVPVEPGEHRIECKWDGETFLNETVHIIPGYDYMVTGFEGQNKKNKHNLFTLEYAWQTYGSRDNVPKQFLPDASIYGFSLYSRPFRWAWLALSLGFDYGRTEYWKAYALRAGVKYRWALGKAEIYIGPDIKFTLFQYKNFPYSDIGREFEVDELMAFSGPGVEWFMVWPVGSFHVAAGVRGHYLPYEYADDPSRDRSSKHHRAFLYNTLISVGYAF